MTGPDGSDLMAEVPARSRPCLAGIVLAAGAGTRLSPLTRLRPKALCPVGGRPLVDLAVDRVAEIADEVWVNVHFGRPSMEEHLLGSRTKDGRPVNLSLEVGEARGTSGAIGLLRERFASFAGVVVANADAWMDSSMIDLVDGWQGELSRVLVAGDDKFGPTSKVAGVLLPKALVDGLEPIPSGLYETVLRPASECGLLEVRRYRGEFVDCGTPSSYLRANMVQSGGRTVLGEGAAVRGIASRCVLWEGTTVDEGEVLEDAIRTSRGCTVLVR